MEQQVILTYTISLPDGTECYRNTDKPGSFVIGRDQVESGLHEVLLLMHLGDRAKVILPSHLAFGLTGDSGKIPSHATLIYDLHLVGIAE
jgi:FKBP-type peptidyl-prolyl cis-trans isomerase FkpA